MTKPFLVAVTDYWETNFPKIGATIIAGTMAVSLASKFQEATVEAGRITEEVAHAYDNGRSGVPKCHEPYYADVVKVEGCDVNETNVLVDTSRAIGEFVSDTQSSFKKGRELARTPG